MQELRQEHAAKNQNDNSTPHDPRDDLPLVGAFLANPFGGHDPAGKLLILFEMGLLQISNLAQQPLDFVERFLRDHDSAWTAGRRRCGVLNAGLLMHGESTPKYARHSAGGTTKSAIHNCDDRSAPRVDVHRMRRQSGLNTGSTSAPGANVSRTFLPVSIFIQYRS